MAFGACAAMGTMIGTFGAAGNVSTDWRFLPHHPLYHPRSMLGMGRSLRLSANILLTQGHVYLAQK
jgi:hypothetical protein